MRVLSSLIAFFLMFSAVIGQSYTSYFTGNEVDKSVNDLKFALTVMGGGSEVDYAMKLFLEDAKGGDVLVLSTSGSDVYNDYLYTELGVDVNSVETIVCHNRGASSDPYVLERIFRAEAIWFADGDQWKHLSYWRDTPLQQYVNFATLDKGIPVGGIGAGMTIMGHYQFTAENGTVTSEQALSDPYNERMTIDNRPFFVLPIAGPIIFDSHFDEPDKKGRMAAFIARVLQDYGKHVIGIGLDEKSAARLELGSQLLFMDDTMDGNDNRGHIFTYDCLADPTEFVVEDGVGLSWTGDHLKYEVVPAAPINSLAFGLLNSSENYNYIGKYSINIDDGVYEQTDISNSIDKLPLPCSVLTDINERNLGNLSLVPNLVVNSLKIETSGRKIEHLEIFSTSGKVGGFDLMDIQNGNTLDVSYLPKGLYFIKILFGSSGTTLKFMKL